MGLDLGQTAHSRSGQTMRTFLFGISSLHAGAGIVFLFPEGSSSGDRADQAIIPVRMQVKGPAVAGGGAGGLKETPAFAQGCRAAELETVSLTVRVKGYKPQTLTVTLEPE